MVNRTELRKAPPRLATSCTECQRRKQKCTREWPCNHCQARQIAHLCKFNSKKAFKPTKPAAKDASHSLKPAINQNHDHTDTSGSFLLSQDESFRALGYLSDYHGGLDDSADIESPPIPSNSQGSLSIEMSNALRVIPPKPYSDILVQHFLDNTNYHYYSLYPPGFLHDYSAWWSSKTNGLPLTKEFTCLLLRVCACSVPYLDIDNRQKLESELGANIQHLSELYHNTARQLSSTIPPGKGGLIQIQQLFLIAQWFKTEALFVESWHALGTAIHEAQEQGLHKGSLNMKISDFDREMRRRLWCILYAWDWQMSLLLSRPPIINTSFYSFELPNLRLETLDAKGECPSPISHISLQCQLGLSISMIPGAMSGALSPTQAVSIQKETEKWFDSFPLAYKLVDPDTQWDSSHNFVTMQRLQLHAIGYMVMLMPLKSCLTMDMNKNSSNIERNLLPTAVECALKLMEASRQLLQHVSPINAKFHFAPFSIFDTAAFLCSAVIHDSSGSLPQRENVIDQIRTALNDLQLISQASKIGNVCYNILRKLAARLPLYSAEGAPTAFKSPQGSIGTSQTIPDAETNPEPFSCPPRANPLNVFGGEFTGLTSFDILPPGGMVDENMGLSDILQLDLGELDAIWNWGNLDLSYPTPV